MNNYATDIDACRSRQQRLIDQMQQRQIDVVIVTQTEHVQWLAGPRFPWVMQAAAALRVDGHLTLAAPQKPILEAAADELVTYEAQWHSTLRNDQRQVCMELLAGSIGKQAGIGRLGVEFSSCGRHGGDVRKKSSISNQPCMSFAAVKTPTQLARIRKAIAGTEKMYRRAREIMRPGITEIGMFNQLQAVAVDVFGEMLTGTGNDYQCRSRGSPPRSGQGS